MPDTINWEAKYLDQIETRLDELTAGQKRMEEKIDQQGKDLRVEIEKAVTPVNRLVWAPFSAVRLGLVKTFFFSPHP